MRGIFISHSTKDKVLVEHVVDLLQSGMGIGRDRIFCTSLNGTLPTGEDFISTIKEKMQEYNVVVAIITPEYLKSLFCVMELGAAWMSAEIVFPILAKGIKYSDLEKTPLKSIQMRCCQKEDDWYAVYDEFLKLQIISKPDTSQVNRKIANFLTDIKTQDNPIIVPNENGYYQVEIIAKRNVPEPFRCYQIKGHLDLSLWGIDFDENESHWLFFKAGAYDDLNVGDVVKFKIHSTERNNFTDIGYARNIYPDDLEIQ